MNSHHHWHYLHQSFRVDIYKIIKFLRFIKKIFDILLRGYETRSSYHDRSGKSFQIRCALRIHGPFHLRSESTTPVYVRVSRKNRRRVTAWAGNWTYTTSRVRLRCAVFGECVEICGRTGNCSSASSANVNVNVSVRVLRVRYVYHLPCVCKIYCI